MTDFTQLTVKELVEGIKTQKFTSEDVVSFYISQCEKKQDLNAVLEIFYDAIEKAKEVDSKIAQGQSLGKLAGVPIIVKDNILNKGKKMTCASKFMQDFVSPYSATIVKKLEAEGAIIIARANMDEFAMGGSCENSAYGPCKNAIDPTCVSGGSSGGSAVAVAADLAPIAIGTDTGGSVRQPSSFNGVVGIKPTYGAISRFGLVAFASSTDQAGPITKTVEDNEYVFDIMAGKDENDQTSIELKQAETKPTYKLGLCKQLAQSIKQSASADYFEKEVERLKQKGFEFVEVDIPHIESSLPCYYVLTPAEATSNLARFDGVKYTTRASDAKNLEEVYIKSRSEGFGKEVKRRIILGNFVLSSGYFDAYYNKARKLQT
jgi:aspartyl-tRNA(Asn)/glutamyl-tRNA(Gln) amidotransferase subunit A